MYYLLVITLEFGVHLIIPFKTSLISVLIFSTLELEQKEVDNLYQVQDHVLWILEPHRSSNVMVLAEPAITLLIL